MSGQNILLVEGKDDEHVLKHICGNRALGNLFQKVKSHGSVESLLESIPIQLKAGEEGDIVGIVVDADTDLTARWQSIRYKLTELGYANVPTEPELKGTIIDPPNDSQMILPRTGIWIMPDNRAKGILEDFLRFLIPQCSKLYQHVEDSLEKIPKEERFFKPVSLPKAKIHTWLAWQEDPGKPLGTAITARFLDPNVPEVDTLVSWLKDLYRG